LDTGETGVVGVFVADPQPVVRDGIRVLIEATDGYRVVGESGSALETLVALSTIEVGLAVLDVRLRDGCGLELLRQARELGVSTRFLVLTSAAGVEAYHRAVLAGADGFVLKEHPRSTFQEAVRVVTAGGQALDPGILQPVGRIRERRVPTRILADLSERERVVLDLLAQGMTNREIGDRLSLAEKTVRNNVSVVLGKLGMKNRTQLAAYVAGLTAVSGEIRQQRPAPRPQGRSRPVLMPASGVR
jgi:two-component system, NarL family, response regulator DevR